jgi:hypothetical protein
MIAASVAGERTVPARARELAARLSALFERDVEIVGRLNDAQSRLRDANERLWSGLAPDALGLVYDGSALAGQSQIAKLMSDARSAGGPDRDTAVLGALQQVHWAIHGSFCAYQSACEERRQLAVDVGELSQQLTEVLCAVGFSAQVARNADVHKLAGAGVR